MEKRFHLKNWKEILFIYLSLKYISRKNKIKSIPFSFQLPQVRNVQCWLRLDTVSYLELIVIIIWLPIPPLLTFNYPSLPVVTFNYSRLTLASFIYLSLLLIIFSYL